MLVLGGCTPPGLPAPIAPASSSVVSSIPATEAAVTIGVDGSVVGFNPHAIADYSPADQAVADLVLPSVSTVAADGSVQLNRDVVDKAEVSSTDPFTVTYTLDRKASWSDGTPITAEDFSYLRDQMLVQPGTIDPAGYRLITSIVSRDAGKSVDVKFAHSVADWPTLFSPLLPAHILKDSPGGWTEGLATGIPVSGNQYKMQSNDAVTGEITLVRNDKYLGYPARPEHSRHPDRNRDGPDRRAEPRRPAGCPAPTGCFRPAIPGEAGPGRSVDLGRLAGHRATGPEQRDGCDGRPERAQGDSCGAGSALRSGRP